MENKKTQTKNQTKEKRFAQKIEKYIADIFEHVPECTPELKHTSDSFMRISFSSSFSFSHGMLIKNGFSLNNMSSKNDKKFVTYGIPKPLTNLINDLLIAEDK